MKSADEEFEQEESNDVNQELDELLKECEHEADIKTDEEENEKVKIEKARENVEEDEQRISESEEEEQNNLFPDTKFNVKIVAVDE